MNQNDKIDLIDRYLAGKTTPTEDAAVERWLNQMNTEEDVWKGKSPDEKKLFVSELYENIKATVSPQTKVVKMNRRPALVAAAVALFVLIGGVWFWTQNKEIANKQDMVSAEDTEIVPGGNKAILTLADGSTIVLDSVNTGAISKQGNVTVIKLNDGELSYQTAGNIATTEVQYNTISTPRGGQYQLILSDGTKVWLNAQSSLRYPAVFVGKERKVELTGEGYFEVAHNVSKPFFVKAGEMNVKVLGTHFNVNAYKEEGRTVASLLTGLIEVVYGSEHKILKPGQQATLLNGSNTELDISNTDVNNSIAWKNGYFQFENLTIQQIMRQISRWYDVRVTYDGPPPVGHYVGKPSRYLDLKEILKIVEYSGIKLTLKNKTIIVED